MLLAALIAIATYGFMLPPSPQSAAVQSAAKPPTKVETPETADDRVADYTEALAWFTGLLALVSATQIFFLIRADSRAAEAAKFMGQQADWMGRQTDSRLGGICGIDHRGRSHRCGQESSDEASAVH